MRLLKFAAIALGATAIITGFDSCKKDSSSIECCTLSYTYAGETTKVKACADGKVTYTYSDGSTDVGDWTADYSSWTLAKQTLIAEGATCK